MFSIIDDFRKKESWVAVYDNSCDVSKFKFGRFLSVNDSRFAMLLVSPNGDYDGIVVDDVEDIFRIDSAGRYHEKIDKLIRFQSNEISPPCINPQFIDESILSYAKDSSRIVAIELHNSGVFDIIGFVKDVSETMCQVRLVNEYGEDDGDTFIDLRSISEISCDSEDERRVMRLYQVSNESTTASNLVPKEAPTAR